MVDASGFGVGAGVGFEVVDSVGFRVGVGVGFAVPQKLQPPHKSAMFPGAQCRPLLFLPLKSASHQLLHSPAGGEGAGVGFEVVVAVGFRGGAGVGFAAPQKEQPPHKKAMSPATQCRPLFLPPLKSASHQLWHSPAGDGVGLEFGQKKHPPHKKAMSPGAQCRPTFFPPL